MREIEYRAKRIDNGEWVYGFYHQLNESFENKECILEHHRNTSTIIDRETLGQYTGLKDKNGVKVYEGDIVKIGSQIGYIVYNYSSFGIGLSKGIDYKKLEQKTLTWLGIENDNFLPLLEVYLNFNDEDEILSEVKVIGNRYDNPELIKESESNGRGE